MITRDPEKNFEKLWETFHNRYPFFELRNVDWRKQYDTYRSKVTRGPVMMSSSISSARCSTRWMMGMWS